MHDEASRDKTSDFSVPASREANLHNKQQKKGNFSLRILITLGKFWIFVRRKMFEPPNVLNMRCLIANSVRARRTSPEALDETKKQRIESETNDPLTSFSLRRPPFRITSPLHHWNDESIKALSVQLLLGCEQ